MKQQRAIYYVNGRNVNQRPADTYPDLPPRLRPPTCELQPAPRPASNQAAAFVMTVALALAIVWLGRLR